MIEKELEEDGIIIRTVYSQVPPKVVYELSEMGETLKEIIDKLCAWGERNETIDASWKKQNSG
jgi:DNA-binding HxlR family transcriptional regulator